MKPGETPDDEARREARRTEAIKLRLQGKSYRMIAGILGVSHMTAYEDVQACFRESRREATAEAKDLEVARYDRYLEVLEESIKGGFCPECGRGDIKAVEAAIKVSKARRELIGLDAPTKVQEVPPDDVDKMTRDEKVAAHRQAIAELEAEGKDGMH